ncbi:Serine/threonine-protein kinase Chk2 [Nymphon striatum]|nr:Serine/threonine-protein kinase Chk2 [Nymphon striatum]
MSYQYFDELPAEAKGQYLENLRVADLKACPYQVPEGCWSRDKCQRGLMWNLCGQEIKFGRDDECNYSFCDGQEDPSVLLAYSKIHFILIREELSTGFHTFLKDTSSNGTFINGTKVGKNMQQVLNNNDEISLLSKKNKAFIYVDLELKENGNYPDSVLNTYTVSKFLGRGACGEVRLVFKKDDCCQAFAMKIIAKKKFSIGGSILKDLSAQVQNEVNVMKNLDHPCIVKIENVIDTPDYLYIILELVEGGELFDRIVSCKKLKESNAKLLFYQMVLAVQRMITAYEAGRKVNLDDILQHELASVPLSIAQFNGSLRTGTKATLVAAIADDIASNPNINHNEQQHLIIDGFALVHAIGKPQGASTFEDLANIFHQPVYQGHYNRVDIVFDRYNKESIKSGTRSSRSKEAKPIRRVIENSTVPLPNNWNNFLALADNKADLARFLSAYLIEHVPRGKVLIVAGGFEEEETVKCSDPAVDVTNYQANHEEADTQVVLHCMHSTADCIVVSSRDTDAENILLTNEEDQTLIKVTDFGLSKLINSSTVMQTFCGTPNYLAPEILISGGKGRYTNAIDCWSLGVILYVCLSGSPPFSNDYPGNVPLAEQIKTGRYSFPNKLWKDVSEDAKDLVRKFLTVKPEERITLDAAIKHPWLQDEDIIDTANKLMYGSKESPSLSTKVITKRTIEKINTEEEISIQNKRTKSEES